MNPRVPPCNGNCYPSQLECHTLIVRQVWLVDENRKARIGLGLTADSRAIISMFGGDGRLRVTLIAHDDGSLVEMKNREGVDRIAFGFEESAGPGFGMLNSAGDVMLEMMVDEDAADIRIKGIGDGGVSLFAA